MSRRIGRVERWTALLSVTGALLMCGCAQRADAVVVYTSLDQVFSEPVLRAFEAESGIVVKAVYDVEATKTTGLVNRLIAERHHPQADVFWNSEVARSILLQHQGVLEPYVSPNAADVPAQFKDAGGYWTGFAARARILMYNTDLVSAEAAPRSISDLTQPRWKNQVALAYPLFGTTATHAASLFVLLGEERAEAYFRALHANRVVIVDGNSTARDRVQDGELPVALTDTDDAHVAIAHGKPVAVVYPDQGPDQIGTLLIPNTVCLIKRGPHPDNGRQLIDYVLDRKTESRLAFSDSAQIPLRDGVPKPDSVPSYRHIKVMAVDFEDVARQMEQTARTMQDIFVR